MEYSTDENNRCPKCGLPFWDDHKSTAVPNLCKCRADNHKWGWECPRCGRVNAPWMPYCNCQITQYKITETQEQATKEVIDQEPITQVRGLIYMINSHKSMIVYPCSTAYLLIEHPNQGENGQDMLTFNIRCNIMQN